MSANCNTASLDVYVPSTENQWNLKKIDHLYKRAAFGVRPDEAADLLNNTISEIIDTMVDGAIALPATAKPSWGDDFTPEDVFSGEPRQEWRRTYLLALLQDGLRERMSFFWSNHFVTEINGYECASYLYRYTKALQENALGNFKTFVHQMGLESAMLLYLNGNQNTKNRPNENYARELYELFTLGEGNGYTQSDIEETARALTGYSKRDSRCSPMYFDEQKFDNEEKIIFGRTGNWNYDDVIDILFEERAEQVSKFIVEKLYVFFVHPELPQDVSIIDGLAQTFRDADFEIAPVLRQLLKSEHFFSSDAMNVIIKSPIDLFLILITEAQFTTPDNDYLNRLNNWSRTTNQQLFSPPNVAGWQGDKDWISSPTLIGRWTYSERLIKDQYKLDKEQFRALAVAIAGQSSDVEYVSRSIVNWFLPEDLLSEQDYLNALDAFKSDSVPENYYEDGTWGLYFETVPKQVCLLLEHIVKQPEFQLK